MTVYTKSLSGIASFAGGQNLYPGGSGVVLAITPDTIVAPDDLLSPDGIYDGLYPSPNIYPFGGAIVATVNHGVAGVFRPSGGFVANSNSRTKALAAALQPQVVFFKGSARLFFAGVLPTAGLVATRTAHSVGQALFASLRATGSLHAINVDQITPPGGGGYSLPMGEDFFQRYKPTLRRQKMRA